MLLYLFSKYNPQQSLPTRHFGTDMIKPSSHTRNIGAIFDNSMPMLPHVNNVCKSAFYHFRTISCIKEILINANYWDSYSRLCNFQTFNSLLYNVPKNVNRCTGAAARLITRSRKCYLITPILFDLLWLLVSERIKFKSLLLTFKALHSRLNHPLLTV